MDAHEAIEESSDRNRMVRIECDPFMENYETLLAECGDYDETRDVVEFWSDVEDGDEWRVELEKPDFDDKFECPRCDHLLSVADVEEATWGESCPNCGFPEHPVFVAAELLM